MTGSQALGRAARVVGVVLEGELRRVHADDDEALGYLLAQART